MKNFKCGLREEWGRDVMVRIEAFCEGLGNCKQKWGRSEVKRNLNQVGRLPGVTAGIIQREFLGSPAARDEGAMGQVCWGAEQRPSRTTTFSLTKSIDDEWDQNTSAMTVVYAPMARALNGEGRHTHSREGVCVDAAHVA